MSSASRFVSPTTPDQRRAKSWCVANSSNAPISLLSFSAMRGRMSLHATLYGGRVGCPSGLS
eukprot:4872634-Prymnesium_polylepis.1